MKIRVWIALVTALTATASQAQTARPPSRADTASPRDTAARRDTTRATGGRVARRATDSARAAARAPGPGDSSRLAGDTAETAAAPTGSPARRPLTGLVRVPDHGPLPAATVTVASADSGVRFAPRTTITDTAGRFAFDSLPPGRYDLRVESAASRAITERVSVVERADNAVVLTALSREGSPSIAQSLWTLLCLVLYGGTILLVRWHHIARSLQAILARQLTALSTRLRTEVGDSCPPGVQPLRTTVEALQADAAGTPARFWEFLFWSRGRENATWVAIHEVERQLATFLAPPEQVEAYLLWSDAELRVINKPPAIAVADAIRGALQSPLPVEGTEQTTAEKNRRMSQERTRKALLGRAISIIYAERDNGFSTLMEWQNKASWLILAALIIILFLTMAAGNAVLFLAGAAGGYLSRLMRAVKRDDVPLDYGASWTTLFLSPILGALAGWFGVALITLATDPELNLLGDAFRRVRWDDPTNAMTLAVAVLLGFSERFFDAVVGALDKQAERGDTGRRAAISAGTPVPITPPASPARDGRTDGLPAAGNGTTPAGGGSGGRLPGALAAGPPVITDVERQHRAAGADRDALLVTGSGFVTGAAATVNDEKRSIEVRSAEALVLPLTADDVHRIDIGGDFVITIVNPNGATSQPLSYV